MPSHIAAAALLPALAVLSASCADTAPPAPPPLSEEALAAVSDDAGAPKDQLAREVDELFTLEGLGETRAVLLLADGKIAAERYGEGYDSETRFISWSMAKTVTAVLVGMLVADGLLSVTVNVSSPPSSTESSIVGTMTVREVTPGSNTSVPLVAV